MLFRIWFVMFAAVLLLQSCAGYDFSRKYVQQGNILSQKRIDHLKLGMSKADVAILMGTSLISPLFSNDRWDYAYTFRKRNKPMAIRRLVLTFKNDHLVHIEHVNQALTR